MIEKLVEIESQYRKVLRQCIDNAPSIFRGARKKLGLSQRTLAKQLGCDHSYISKIENGRLTPGKPILYKLGKLLNEQKEG